MGKNECVAPAALAVCLFTASNYPEKTFLALIKLDLMRAFVQEVKPRNGGQVISYEEYRNVMPTRGEKLNKAAII